MSSVNDRATRVWRWRIFGATWIAYAGYYFCRKPFYITKAALQTELGWDASTLANIGAIYLVAYAIGHFTAGAAGGRFGPRVLLLVGMAVSAGCNIAFGLTNSTVTFAAFMFVNGLAQATGWSNTVGTMASWFHRRERGTVMGWWCTHFQFGGIASNTLAAWLLGRWGYSWSYVSGAAVLLLAWAVVLLFQRNRPEDVGLPPVAERDGESHPEKVGGWTPQILTNVLIVGVFYFFVKFIRYALWSWAPYLLERSYGMKGDEAGYLSTVFDVAGIAGVVAIGWISDRCFRGRRVPVSLASIACMTIACGMLVVLGDRSLVLFAICIGLIGFTLFGPDTLMSGAGAIDVGTRKTAVLATGIINGMGSAGSVLQELVLGRLLDKGDLAPAFATLLGSSILATGCLVVLEWRNRTGRADL